MGYEGGRKLATVLFADIVDSTSLVAGKDPEDANDCVLPIVRLLIDVVNRFGGTVAHVLGDGILAVFGAPRAQEDHALWACLAAEQMISLTNNAVRKTGASRPVRYGLRIGVSSGEIIAQQIETGNVTELRAAGETVYLAARLEKADRPGSVLITESTLALTSGRVKARRVGCYSLAPASKPTAVYEVVAVEKRRRTAFDLADRNESELVGRATDLSVLQSALARAASGRGNVVVLVGEAGIGKSRLVSELLRSEPARSCRIIEHGMLPFGQSASSEPLACITRNLLSLDYDIGPETARAIVAAKLRAAGAEQDHAVAAVLEICGFPATDDAWTSIAPSERMDLAIETIAEAALSCGDGRPFIIRIEDFHWADSGTRSLVEALASRISRSNGLLLITSRSLRDRAWARWPGAIRLPLGPLARDNCWDLLNALVGRSPDLEDLKLLLIEETQGNPFFLMECCQALKDSGAVRRTAGGYRLGRPVNEITIPGSVQAVLAERIDNLSPAERDVLFSATVIGQTFDVDLLQGILGVDKKAVLARLARLTRMGFVERTRIIPNLEFSFRHALIHDVTYGTLLKRERRHMHGRLCALIKKRPSHELSAKIELLAHHTFLAERWRWAFLYNRRAGQAAQWRSREREAARFFRNALQALARLPRTPKNLRRSTDVRLELAQSLFPIGQCEQARFELQEADRLARVLGDEHRVAEIASTRTLCHWISGSIPQAIRTGRTALRLANKLDRRDLKISCAIRLGALFLDRGYYESAADLLTGVVTNLTDDDSPEQFGLITAAGVSSRASLALALATLGRFDEAQTAASEALGIADDVRHTFSQIYASVYVGNALLRRGDFAIARHLLEHGLHLCQSVRSKLLQPWMASSLGHAHVRLGNHVEGLRLLENAVAISTFRPLTSRLALWLSWLAEAYLAVGRLDESYSCGMRALNTARRCGERGHEAQALWVLGDIWAQLGPTPAKAMTYIDRSLVLARSCGMKPLRARCHSSAGEILRRFGRWDEADREFKRAHRLNKILNMPYGLDGTEAALRETELA